MPENELIIEEQLTLTKHFELETPHPESSVEWWFYHGYFEGETVGKRFFMVSFFRYNLAEQNEPPDAGYSLLFSILNPETGENKTLSQVDKNVLEGVSRHLKNEPDFELDPDLIKILSKEFDQYGPPRPIRLKNAQCDLSGSALHIEWDDFTLQQDDECFKVQFPLLEDQEICSITLHPETGRFEFNTGDGTGRTEGDLVYHCYPELRLTGSIGEETITGRAWMDHQWGDKSRNDHIKLSGWDWIGFNLDDGTNIITVSHKDAKTREELYSRTVVMRNGEPPVFVDGLRMEPVEFWESPLTNIKYPVSWKIENDNLGLSITFKPTVNDQEIPVFGLARSVWEGAGTVSGTIQGQKVSGRARGEFHGYGYIFDFQDYLKEFADKVDQRIEEFFPKEMSDEVIQRFAGKPHWKNEPGAYTEMLSKPVWDLILRRGKRWRPIFGIWMQEALGKSSTNYERGICLSELIHTGSLIVDDIEDQSELRRGQPALHLKYGLDVALNAGNTLYFLPIAEVFDHAHLNDNEKLKVHQVLMDTHLKSHFGQTLDIYWSKHMSLENLSKWLNDDIESKILQMYDYKTAAGPKGITRLAAFFAGSDEFVTEIAISFARSFAVAFQIIDDVLNFSNSSKWSKVCGEDISNGKLTYVIARAIKNLDGAKKERFKEILCDKELRRETEPLQEAVQLANDSGALEECISEAKKMSLQAWDRFAEIVPSSEPKIMLNMLCFKMLDLAYDT